MITPVQEHVAVRFENAVSVFVVEEKFRNREVETLFGLLHNLAVRVKNNVRNAAFGRIRQVAVIAHLCVCE